MPARTPAEAQLIDEKKEGKCGKKNASWWIWAEKN